MTCRFPGRRWAIPAVLAASWLSFAAPGHARTGLWQDTAPAPTQDSAAAQTPEATQAAPATDPDSIQGIQERLAALEDPAVSEPLGDQLEVLRVRLNDALTRLRLAAAHTTQMEEFRKKAAEAPARMAEIQAELQQSPNGETLTVEPGLNLTELETRLREAEADFTAKSEEVTSIDTEQKDRVDRRTQIGAETVEATRDLEQARARLDAPVATDEPPLLVEAQRTLWKAQRQEAEAKLALLREEASSYDVRRDLIIARKDRAIRRRNNAEKRFNFWRQEVDKGRQAELEKQRQEAERSQREAGRSHELVKDAADQFAELVAEKGRVLERVAEVQQQQSADQARLDSLEAQYQTLRPKVDADLDNDIIGQTLRNQRAEVPSLRRLERQIRTRATEVTTALVRTHDLDVEHERLNDIPGVVDKATAELRATQPDIADDVAAELTRLLEEQRKVVSDLGDEYRRLDDALSSLDAVEVKLLEVAREFSKFIDENVLWIRSHSVLGLQDLRDAVILPVAVFGPSGLRDLAVSAAAGARTRPLLVGILGLAIAVLGLRRRRLWAVLRDALERSSRKETDAIVLTLRALLASVLLALWWPALLLVAGILLQVDPDSGDGVRGVSRGLVAASIAMFTATLLWRLCMKGGLAETHFRWRARGVSLIRRWMPLWILVVVPLEFMVICAEEARRLEPHESAGRLAFIVMNLFLCGFLYRLLRPVGGVMEDVRAKNPRSVFSRFLWAWFPLVVGGPALLAVLAIFGFYYTAWNLLLSFEQTLWLIFAMVLVQALVERYSFVAWRRLALQQAQRRREELAAAQAEGTAPASEAVVVEEPSVDLWTVNQQTRQLLRTGIGVALLLGVWAIWADVVPALGVFDEVPLWSQSSQIEQVVPASGDVAEQVRTVTVETRVTLLDLLAALFVFLLSMAAARNVPGVLEITLLQRLPLEPGGRYAVTTLVRYLITGVGVVVSFTLLGMGWSKVQWLVAAMTVGLGFGLQEIFANFVSGLILLFERPIRLGDTVTVGTVTGTVSKIRIRATTITDWDRKELVVPNKEFVTGQIINWTLSDSVLRLVVPVGVAYGSDTRKVQNLLLKVARRQKVVLKDPAPSALFLGFGDSSLNFELRVFLPGIEHLIGVRHELHMGIDDEFRRNGVEIPFPQRDLHIRPGDGTVQYVQRGPVAGGDPGTAAAE